MVPLSLCLRVGMYLGMAGGHWHMIGDQTLARKKTFPVDIAIGIGSGIGMCFVFGIAGRPFAPISLNTCFLHACAGHWPVAIAWHLPWKLPQCSWPLERALDVNAWPCVCWVVHGT